MENIVDKSVKEDNNSNNDIKKNEQEKNNDIDKLTQKKFMDTNINKYNKYENLTLSITSSFYSNIDYIKAEEIKNYLKPTSNHGLTGLKNLGNSAYMNSIIQCLSNTPELMFYYVSGLYKKDLKITETKKKGFVQGKLSQEFSSLLAKMWIDNKKTANPQEVKYAICDILSSYNSNNQQDSSELLINFLNLLHNEINKEKSKGSGHFYEPPKKENESDISASQRFWNLFRNFNNSIIIDLFYGQLKNTTRCLSCAHIETSFEIFNLLPIEIPTLKKINVLLVPSNNIKNVIKLSIFVSSTALFIDLGVYIKQYIKTGFENFRIMLINYNTTNCKFVKMSHNIYNTAKKGIILVQEISELLNDTEIQDDENDEGGNEEYSAEMGEYFPFITLVKYKNFEDLGGIIDTNLKSYPRIFPMGPYTKIKGLRIKLFGHLVKYYPLPETIVDFLKNKFPGDYKSIPEIIENYTKNNIEIEETDLNDIYAKQYNLIFNENYQKSLEINENVKSAIDEYLRNFPFVCNLINTKGNSDEKIFLSGDIANYQNSLKDNQKINDIVSLIRNKYILTLYITKESYIKPLNEIITITSTKENSENKIPTLTDALIHYSLNEKLEKENEWFCPNCKKLVNAYHKSEIFYMPPYLILQIKRFVRNYISKTKVQLLKLNDQLNYNIDFADLDNFVAGPKNPKNYYQLYAVNQHSGSNEGGHYCSACKNFGKWYMFDDHAVFPCEDDMICVPEGYLLFYRRVKDYKKLIEHIKKKQKKYETKAEDNEKENKNKNEEDSDEDIKEVENESEEGGEEEDDDEEDKEEE